MQTRSSEPDGISLDLDAYFESIKPAFDNLQASKERAHEEQYDGTGGTIVFFLFLFFSLVPVIPLIGYLVSRWIRSPLSFAVFHRTFSAHTFLFWYVACVVVSAALFGLRLRYASHLEKKSAIKISARREDALSDPHVRFALCYAMRSEIEDYRTNKLKHHIEKAREYWNNFIPLLREALGSDRYWSDPRYMANPRMYFEAELRATPLKQQRKQFFPEVHKLLSDFSWFKLDATTEGIILAFDDLQPKLNDRLYDKKDLDQISKCLLPLEFYLYTQIPDIADTEEDRERLKQVEKSSLMSFVHEMSVLDKYLSPNTASPVIPKSVVKKEKLAKLLTLTVGNPSPFLRFSSIWFVVQSGLAIAVPIFLIADRAIKLDSTLIALLVGSPLAIAAGLTAIPLEKYGDSKRK
jgi:uncharacterized membrane protein